MTLPDLIFPAIGLQESPFGSETWDLFWDADDFSAVEAWKVGQRPGMLLVDSETRFWRVCGVRDLGHVGGRWERLLRFLTRNRVRRLDQDLVLLPDMTINDFKARFCAAIQNNWDHWRDDEAIAGEDDPPRDEQELRNELKGQVLRAASIPELVSQLWGEDLSKVLRCVASSRAAIAMRAQ